MHRTQTSSETTASGDGAGDDEATGAWLGGAGARDVEGERRNTGDGCAGPWVTDCVLGAQEGAKDLEGEAVASSERGGERGGAVGTRAGDGDEVDDGGDADSATLEDGDACGDCEPLGAVGDAGSDKGEQESDSEGGEGTGGGAGART